MSREKLFVCRALSDWQPDGVGDHENTLILHDFARVVFGDPSAQAVQNGRHDDDPGQPTFAELTGPQIAALNARIGAIQSGHATYIPPGSPAPPPQGKAPR